MTSTGARSSDRDVAAPPEGRRDLRRRSSGGGERGTTLAERRVARLRDELIDDAVPLPIDGAAGDVLLRELVYARYPPRHEGRAPAYGALVFADDEPDWSAAPIALKVVPAADVASGIVRLHADGRASFVVVSPGGVEGLAVFDLTAQYESIAVRLRDTGAIVVQRDAGGLVRVCSDAGVVRWDGSGWTFKPLAAHFAPFVRRLAPRVDERALAGLLELAVHWLSAGHVGATLVWCIDGVATDDDRNGSVELDQAFRGPPLSVADRGSFPALLAALSQIDLAAMIAADGTIGPMGVRLRESAQAVTLVSPAGGARHTSARRFSFDAPGVLVFAVSEDGPVTVFGGGAVAAEIRTDPCRTGFPLGQLAPIDPQPDEVETLRCPQCHRLLLVDVLRVEGWPGGPDHLACPVCGHDLMVDAYRAAIRGVVATPQ